LYCEISIFAKTLQYDDNRNGELHHQQKRTAIPFKEVGYNSSNNENQAKTIELETARKGDDRNDYRNDGRNKCFNE